MKTTLALLAIVAAWSVTGCTQTKVTAPGFQLTRTSFLQRLEFSGVEVGTNGTMKLDGYKTDGGNEAVAKITAAAVSAAVSAAK